jgi:hypothetical protein
MFGCALADHQSPRLAFQQQSVIAGSVGKNGTCA